MEVTGWNWFRFAKVNIEILRWPCPKFEEMCLFFHEQGDPVGVDARGGVAAGSEGVFEVLRAHKVTGEEVGGGVISKKDVDLHAAATVVCEPWCAGGSFVPDRLQVGEALHVVRRAGNGGKADG